MPRDRSAREGEVQGLAAFVTQERRRLFDDASPERRAHLRAAERRAAVFRAWNEVVAGTREGGHVTGLHFLPESNELVVYLDAASWTQEMTMLREIIRARMAARGADVAALQFRTSRAGYQSNADRARATGTGPASARPAAIAPRPRPAPAPRAPLSPAEDAALDRGVSPIADERLREALLKAEKANLEWKKGQGLKKTP